MVGRWKWRGALILQQFIGSRVFNRFYSIWEVFYLPPSAFFRCTSTFDARHSLNRFPFAGSVTEQENETERCDWLDRKATTFCVP